MMDDYGAEIMGVRDDSYEAQILRLGEYIAENLPDFIWQDAATVDVAISALETLTAELHRRRQLDTVINKMSFGEKELGYAGL
jgi:hypothetical protein